MRDHRRRRIRRAATAATVALATATLLVSARLLFPADAPAVRDSGTAGSGVAPVAGASLPDSGPCAGEAHRQFDFWRGTWEVHADGERVGHNEIRVVAGGCGLQEAWRSADGGRGRSLNYYDPSDGRWHQLWLGSGGVILHLAGGLEGKAMVMTGERTAEGDRLRDRISWTPLAGGRVRQLWEVSSDGGGTWTPVFDGRYQTE